MKAKFESGALRGKIHSNGTVNGGAVSKSNGTYDYEKLKNQPSVNGQKLIGNIDVTISKTTAEWELETELVSVLDTVYVYTDAAMDTDENPIPMIKVGDGETLVNDLPFVTSIDITVPEWAKESEKPTYTYDEVGAVGAENELHITEIDRMFATVFGE